MPEFEKKPNRERILRERGIMQAVAHGAHEGTTGVEKSVDNLPLPSPIGADCIQLLKVIPERIPLELIDDIGSDASPYQFSYCFTAGRLEERGLPGPIQLVRVGTRLDQEPYALCTSDFGRRKKWNVI